MHKLHSYPPNLRLFSRKENESSAGQAGWSHPVDTEFLQTAGRASPRSTQQVRSQDAEIIHEDTRYSRKVKSL